MFGACAGVVCFLVLVGFIIMIINLAIKDISVESILVNKQILANYLIIIIIIC